MNFLLGLAVVLATSVTSLAGSLDGKYLSFNFTDLKEITVFKDGNLVTYTLPEIEVSSYPDRTSLDMDHSKCILPDLGETVSNVKAHGIASQSKELQNPTPIVVTIPSGTRVSGLCSGISKKLVAAYFIRPRHLKFWIKTLDEENTVSAEEAQEIKAESERAGRIEEEFKELGRLITNKEFAKARLASVALNRNDLSGPQSRILKALVGDMPETERSMGFALTRQDDANQVKSTFGFDVDAMTSREFLEALKDFAKSGKPSGKVDRYGPSSILMPLIESLSDVEVQALNPTLEVIAKGALDKLLEALKTTTDRFDDNLRMQSRELRSALINVSTSVRTPQALNSFAALLTTIQLKQANDGAFAKTVDNFVLAPAYEIAGNWAYRNKVLTPEFRKVLTDTGYKVQP